MKRHLTFYFLALLLILIANTSLAYMGIIRNEPKPDNCKLIRNNIVLKCNKGDSLYIGDSLQIGFPIEDLNIYLLPHAKIVQDNKGTYHVAKAQDAKEGWIRALIEDNFGKEKHYSATTAVRGVSKSSIEAFVEAIKVTPPSEATVLPEIPIIFRWRSGEGEVLVIENMAGKIVYSQTLGNSDYYELVPEKAGLKAGHKYEWYYRGDILEDRYILNILNMENIATAEINTELKKLPEVKSVDDAIYVSTFLQVISDLDDSLDFYWLSYQILPRNFNNLDEIQKNKVFNLISRYYDRTKIRH